MSLEEFRSLIHSREQSAEMRAFERTFGVFGGVEKRTFAHTVGEVRSAGTQVSGRNDGSTQVIGHASVFDQPSIEMASPYGIFTEFIDRNAFTKVLQRNPDVLLTWDHDTRWILGRTGNNTLDLTVDAVGLRYWSRIASTSYAEDLRILMEGGYLNQSSFLFRIAPGGEEWSFTEDAEGNEIVTRRITEVGELFDVCVCASGAYPATDSGLMRTIAREYARSAGFAVAVPSRINPMATPNEMRALGEVAWGPEDGVDDLACDIEEQLNEDHSLYCFSVVDVAVNLDKAIICNWDDGSYWVVPFTMEGDEPVVSDPSEWVQVESAWVTTAEGYEANIRSAKIRREARMADETTVVEPEAEAEAEVVAEAEVEEPAAEVEEPEAEAEVAEVEETPEVKAEAEVAEPEAELEVEADDAAARSAEKARLLAEARTRIARAKTI